MKPSGKVGNVKKKDIPDATISINWFCFVVLPALGIYSVVKDRKAQTKEYHAPDTRFICRNL